MAGDRPAANRREIRQELMAAACDRDGGVLSLDQERWLLTELDRIKEIAFAMAPASVRIADIQRRFTDGES